MTTSEMTATDLIVSIAQTYPWGRNASLDLSSGRIVGCVATFTSDKEATATGFSIPATIEAVCDTVDALKTVH